MSHKAFKPPSLLKRPLVASPNSEVDVDRNATKKIRLSEEPSLHENGTLQTHRKPVSTFVKPRPALVPIADGNSSQPAHDKESSLDRYYNVLWRKFTNKKHKTWDGDGVLSVCGGYATLQDVDGRPLGKTALSKPLLCGSTLSIGGKEVEVDSTISKTDFLAGKPFLNGAPEKAKPAAVKQFSKPTMKYKINPPNTDEHGLKPVQPITSVKLAPFRKPLLKSASTNQISRQPNTPQPRHDPSAPGALVMARPTTVTKNKAIVDVVVDPLLSRHLREHQREGVRFLYECVMGFRGQQGEGAILADEMGLGKTLQTIALLWTLLKQNPIHEAPPVVKKALIVCPVTLINNWRKEIRKWLGPDRLGVFVVDDKKARLTDFTKGKAYSVMIVGYEKLRLIQDELKKGETIDIVVADEGHRLKTAQNKSAAAIKAFSTEKRIILTGTPIQNDLSEFWTMVDFVNPGLLKKYNTFKREVETPMLRSRQPNASPEDIEKGEARSEELAQITSQFILRRTADIIAHYLPPKTESIVFCRPTSIQAKLYKAVIQSPLFTAILGSTEASLQLITILKKLCNSPSLFLNAKTDAGGDKKGETITELLAGIDTSLLKAGPAASAKLRVLDGLLNQIRITDEKVVVVSNYTSTLDLIANLLNSLGYPHLRLDGKTPASKRQGIVDQFNRLPIDKCFVFLLSTKAGGTGLNLVAASRLVLFDSDWNPANDLQAMARIHRDGQKKPCYIYRLLLQGALDEKIYQRQLTKTGLADAVVDAKKTSQGFTREELRDLFRLDENDNCPTHELLSCSCNGEGNATALDNSEESFGTNMDDPAADVSEDELPGVNSLCSADQVDFDALQQKRDTRTAAFRKRQQTGTQLALMQYLHIDASKVRIGDVDLEALVEDRALLDVIKAPDSRASFVFCRTTG